VVTELPKARRTIALSANGGADESQSMCERALGFSRARDDREPALVDDRFQALVPREQASLLQLLIERVDYDHGSNDAGARDSGG
jgi:hypothetical protein